MGIYLPNMEMPEERESFTLTIKYNGLVFDTETGIQVAEAQEVPPHGRLIDADALMHEFEKAQHTMQQHGREYSCSFMSSSQELSTEWYCVEDMLENAPTILEAEEAEWTKDNICSRCGDEACAGYDEEPWLTRYCPHCGAKMKNSEDYE